MSDSSTSTRTPITKIVTASLIGTTIEWYDFFLYGTAAALVFHELFFPRFDPLTGTLLAFSTYAIGFVARPVGGLVFGHFGDKIGRKRLLVLSLVLMGGATCAMGLLPTYAAVGAAAPLMLTFLRLVQGFALGGEWGGAVLIVSEHGDNHSRGLRAAWPQCGAPAGNVLATLVLTVLTLVQSQEDFLTWGWRIPFLLSGVLLILGLWIRLSVSESPAFVAAQQAAQQSGEHSKVPLVELFRGYWREVLITIGARIAENFSYFLITVFLLTYITGPLEMSRSVGLTAVLFGSVVHFVTMPMYAALSDRIGRRPVYLFGSIAMAVWGFVFFALLDTRSAAWTTVAVTVGLLIHGAMYGPQSAFFAEQFGTRVRYTGLSVGAQLSAVVAGGLAPVIGIALLQAFHSTVPISLYLLGTCVITSVAVYLARETAGQPLADEPGAPAPAPAGRNAEPVPVRE
ncbi:major facilitator transporter [Rhodococcus ruber BKS 20-38]|uniref:Putative proline/betaine transporter n=1 Tax=Rhodococcus ruber BKS 20-38 TaxID=1278076 RepID=M2XQU8_9NOCA|nr:MFS transporter [Rhodococcus ruber]EME51525.1 major facilitator transporter [Rhodococcus ruber BKS 20-38]